MSRERSHDGAADVKADGLVNRLMRGLGATLLGQLLNVASRLILPPLFLHAWGVGTYGEWLLLSSFAAYLSLTDMGGQLYIVNRLTQAYASKDMASFRTILRSGLAIFLIMPGIFFLGFIFLINIWHLDTLFGITQTAYRDVLLVLIILAFQYLFSLPQGIVLGVYRAIEQYPRGVMLGNLIPLLQLVLTGILLWQHAGMAAIAAVQTIPYVLVLVVALIDLQRRHPELQVLSMRGASLTTALGFVHPSMYFFVIQLAQMISIQGTLLAVGAALGSAEVVLFGMLRTMVFSARQVLTLLSHPAWPEVTRLDAIGDKTKLRKLFQAVFAATMLATLAITAILHFWGDEIFHLWLGDKLSYRQSTMDVFIAYIILNILWTTASHLPMALNRHVELAKLSLLSSVAGVILAYWGGVHYGLDGAVIGMLIGEALLVTWYIPLKVWQYLSNTP